MHFPWAIFKNIIENLWLCLGTGKRKSFNTEWSLLQPDSSINKINYWFSVF